MRKAPIEYSTYTEEELLAMKKSEAIAGLTEQQQRFCECYIEGHNKMAKVKLMLHGFFIMRRYKDIFVGSKQEF